MKSQMTYWKWIESNEVGSNLVSLKLHNEHSFCLPTTYLSYHNLVECMNWSCKEFEVSKLCMHVVDYIM